MGITDSAGGWNLIYSVHFGIGGPGAIDRGNSMIIVAWSSYRRNPKLRVQVSSERRSDACGAISRGCSAMKTK